MIEWNERRMATGEPTIDDQHKELIRMIGEMHKAAAEGKGRAQAARFLDFLAEYVAKHFAYEERAFRLCRCPFAQQNKAAHAEFVQTFKGLRQKAIQQGVTLPVFLEIQKLASNWLQVHICNVDTRIRESLAAKAE